MHLHSARSAESSAPTMPSPSVPSSELPQGAVFFEGSDLRHFSCLPVTRISSRRSLAHNVLFKNLNGLFIFKVQEPNKKLGFLLWPLIKWEMIVVLEKKKNQYTTLSLDFMHPTQNSEREKIIYTC